MQPYPPLPERPYRHPHGRPAPFHCRRPDHGANAAGGSNQITPEHLHPHKIRRGERLLFKTRNSATSWQRDHFDRHFVSIRQDAGEYLAQRGVRTVGVDYLSIGGFEKDGVETHQVMLGAGIWIIEGLNLSAVEPGRYQMICLPLKIIGADGAPCRVIVR